jgi:hypothetical protein
VDPSAEAFRASLFYATSFFSLITFANALRFHIIDRCRRLNIAPGIISLSTVGRFTYPHKIDKSQYFAAANRWPKINFSSFPLTLQHRFGICGYMGDPQQPL